MERSNILKNTVGFHVLKNFHKSVLDFSLSGCSVSGKTRGDGKTEEITQNKELVND